MRFKRAKHLLAVMIMIGLCMFWAVKTEAENTDNDIVQYTDFYAPESELANEYSVNMDGEIEIEIPDFAINCVEIVLAEGNTPVIGKIENAEGEMLSVEKIAGDGINFNIYRINEPKSGTWTVKLEDGEYEKMKVFVLLHSSNVAKFAFEDEIDNPGSANCQALMRIYDSAEEKVLDLSDMTVLYDVTISGVEYDLSMTKKMDDCYKGGLLGGKVNDYTATVVIQQGEGIKVLPKTVEADKKEFAKLINELSPSWFEQFKGKSAEEKKQVVITIVITFVLLAIGVLVVWLMWKKRQKIKAAGKLAISTSQGTKIEEYTEYQGKIDDQKRKMEKIFSDKGLEEYAASVEIIEPWIALTEWEKERISLEQINELKNRISGIGTKVEELMSLWNQRMNNSKKPQVDDLKEVIDKYYSDMERAYNLVAERLNHLSEYVQEILYFDNQEIKKDCVLYAMVNGINFRAIIPARLPGRSKNETGIVDLHKLNMIDRAGRIKGRVKIGEYLNADVKICMVFKDGDVILVSNKKLASEELKETNNGSKKIGPYRYSMLTNDNIEISNMILAVEKSKSR